MTQPGPAATSAVIDWIAAGAAHYPAKIATIDLHSGRRHSYAVMHDRVGRLAGHLAALGCGRGDRVAMLSLNSSDMLDVQFACWRLGLIYTPLNFRLTATELAFMVNDSDARVFFFDTSLADVQAALQPLTKVAHWIALAASGEASPFEAAIAGATPITGQVAQAGDDLCMIMYSSGTTGTPKGVTFSHAQCHFAFAGMVASANASSDMVSAAVMPLFHIGGLAIFTLPALHFGGTAVIVRAFEPGAMLGLFDTPALGITHFLGVPAIFNAMGAHADFATTDFSRLRAIFVGAESVPEPLLRLWFDRGIALREGFGMTETCAVTLMCDAADVPGKIGSAGRPVRWCNVRIARDDGSTAEIGEKGEIWIQGLNVTPGYWNRPDANAGSFVEGWFRSGDIGRMDADGYFTIEDRLKDMYISGGENVYPAEIESLLYAHPAIREVAVIGLPDAKWGECGCAVVALKPGATLGLDEIIAHCAGRLARFKLPARLELVEALPRNATGKVLKFELRDRYR
ncbi:MAG: acyl-CoA synthetase [Polymorphobacter sp.]